MSTPPGTSQDRAGQARRPWLARRGPLLVLCALALLGSLGLLWRARSRDTVAAAQGAGRTAAAPLAPARPGLGSTTVAPPSTAPGALVPQPVVPAPPAAPLRAGPAPSGDRVFVRAKWGAGPGELGRTRAQEGNAEAPLALTVDGRGTVSVLDQVNGRIARWSAQGEPLAPWPLTQQTARELSAGPGGALALLDPTRDLSVAVLGPDGRPLGEAPIRGQGFDDPAQATGLHFDESGVYVEKGHALFTRVADAQGRPVAERAVLDGRPGRAGNVLLSAAIIEARAGTAWVRTVDRASGALRWQRRYTLPAPILRLVLLESDAEGHIAFGLHLAREVEPGRFTDESLQVLCLAADGVVRDVVALPPPEGPEEALRELALAADGTLLYLHRTADEARLLRLRCGPR